MTQTDAMLYVVADVHGHRAELHEVLRSENLVDAAGFWSGGRGRLWFLGDYVDRGPDGIGVIEDLRLWIAQAQAAGGEVHALLGNHELQFMAAQRFGRTPVEQLGEYHDFEQGWLSFGGNENDLARVTEEQLSWIASLPAMAVVDGYLLLHSDTARYLEFGSSFTEVNAAVAAALSETTADDWVELCDRMSDRRGFLDDVQSVDRMLRTFGAHTVVHGHSTLTKYFGYAPENVRGPHVYADGRVIAVDGGVYEGGKVLLARLSARRRGLMSGK